MQITPDRKIGDLKKQLGHEFDDVYLAHEGKKLNEKREVADYPNIQKDSTLVVCYRARGGGNDTSKEKIKDNAKKIIPNKILFAKDSDRLNSLMEDKRLENFISSRDKYDRDKQRLPKSIKTLEDLKNFANIANEINSNLNHSIANTFTDKETIRKWKNEVQKSLYDLRDKMLKKYNLNPEQVFGLKSQFDKKFPGKEMPPALEQVRLNPRLFTYTPPGSTATDPNYNHNDCGAFANRLQVARKEAIQEINESNPEEATRIAENTRKVVL